MSKSLMTKSLQWILVLGAVALSAALFGLITYRVALWASPAVVLIDGEHYHVMPVGHVFISFAAAGGFAIAALYALWRRFLR